MAKSFDTAGIAKRFFSLFPNKKLTDIAALFNSSTGTTSDWRTGKKPIPWDKMRLAVELKGASWDWLLEGRGPVQAGNTGPDPNVVLLGQWQKSGVMRKVHIQIYEDD